MSGALRAFTIGLTAFLTVVDLFATQAILPSLTAAYGVTPAAMGFAVNASTIGMAIGGLAVGLFGRSIDRRRGILAQPGDPVPANLASGHHARRCRSSPCCASCRGFACRRPLRSRSPILASTRAAADTASAFAAYITGNVASNLFGRLLAAGVVDHLGLAANFYVFAALNLSGAVLVWFTVERAPADAAERT